MVKNLFLLVFVCLTSSAVFAQYYTVQGKIVNGSTGEPLAGASVFAQNTTIGTASDNNGYFKLNLPDGGYDIVVTYTGYNTASRRVSTGDADNKAQNFTLGEKQKDLEDVIIVASNEVKDGLAKYGQFFMNNFLGQTANSRNCRILNPEILKFYFYKRSNRLKVLANERLNIENLSLGYNISYALDSFSHEYNSNTSIYTGYPLFEEIPARDSILGLQWKEARREAYLGSALHFMRGVYNKTLVQDGFEIKFLMEMKGSEKAYAVNDLYAGLHYDKDESTETVEIKPNLPRLGIIYHKAKPSPAYLLKNPGEPKTFRFTVVNFSADEPIVVEKNGYYYDQNDLTVGGWWAWEKVADLLPYNFSTTDVVKVYVEVIEVVEELKPVDSLQKVEATEVIEKKEVIE